MGTATQHPPHAPHHPHGAGHPPAPIDPEKDIDAKSTTIWFIVSTIVFFVSFYFLLPLFDRVMTQERTRKIDHAPLLELVDVVAQEQKFLRGEESKTKKTIEQVMKEMK